MGDSKRVNHILNRKIVVVKTIVTIDMVLNKHILNEIFQKTELLLQQKM